MKIESKQLLVRYAALQQAYNLLAKKERQELEAWDRRHVIGDGKFGSSDWPGWDKYLAKLSESREAGS